MIRSIQRRIAIALAVGLAVISAALATALAMAIAPALVRSVQGEHPPSPGVYGCRSDLDCNLNGICNTTDGICICDAAWSAAPNCSALRLLPTTIRSGYRPPDTSSWGGSVHYSDEKDGGDGLYHLYPAEITHHCGLTAWQTNSRVVHATSETLEGPYEFRDEVLGVWSHNPQLLRVPVPVPANDTNRKDNRTVLLLLSAGYGNGPYGTGMQGPPQTCGPTGCCSHGKSPCGIHRGHPCPERGTWPPLDPPDPRARNPLGRYRNVTVLVSPSGSPNGPWVPAVLPLSEDQSSHQYTPTGVAFPNGTVVLWLIGGGGGLFRADRWEGPYERWGDPSNGENNDLQWGCSTGSSGGEDPFVYLDGRGHWHCLFHAGPYFDLRVAGGHAFSLDGTTWHTTPTPAYRGDWIDEIIVENGNGNENENDDYNNGDDNDNDSGNGNGNGNDASSSGNTGSKSRAQERVIRTRIAKRERPHLVFGDDGTTIVALSTGICRGTDWHLCNNNPWPGGFDRTVTHVQLVATAANTNTYTYRSTTSNNDNDNDNYNHNYRSEHIATEEK